LIKVDGYLLQEEVTAALETHGRQRANDRLWPRLDGKVKLEEFITALRKIDNNDLADKIEGLLLLISMQDSVPAVIALQSPFDFGTP